MKKPCVVWLTGLSGSGKSTIAQSSKIHLKKKFNVKIIDGDNIRDKMNNNLGFAPNEIKENNYRIIEICRKEREADILLVSVISPFRTIRKRSRKIFGENYIEVFVNCSLEVCKSRDVKGLYKRLERAEIINFVGVHIPYEQPENPDLILNTEEESVETSVYKLVDFLDSKLAS